MGKEVKSPGEDAEAREGAPGKGEAPSPGFHKSS